MSALPAFDKSLLPPAIAEVVVISDAHYALPSAPSAAEFPSRGRQTARLLSALEVARALGASTCVHLGDLTQEPPESPLFGAARGAAAETFTAAGLHPVWVPGNHDVGDKPDPLMAAHPASREFVAAFEAAHGPGCRTFECGGVGWLTLNTQILGTGWPEEEDQRRRVEEELGRHPERRHVLLLHLPPFIHSAGEPSAGHYDNIPLEPRRWLLDLCRRHRIELVLAGHIHHRSVHRHEATTIATCASPSFTRPGFAAAFAAKAPPERGRDDRPKLGIHLLRVRPNRLDHHFIRTGGAEHPADVFPAGGVPLLTPLARDLHDPRLVVTLAVPLATTAAIPWAWPYATRAVFRSDYPLLLLQELAPAAVRVAAADWADPAQRERLELLREWGIRVEAVHLWSADLSALPDPVTPAPDLVEVQIPGELPDPPTLEALRRWLGAKPPPVRLSPIDPRQSVAGKQHHRFRCAWRAEDAAPLADIFRRAGWHPQAVMFLAEEIERIPAELPWRADFLHQPGEDEEALTVRLLRAVHGRPQSQLHVAPLVRLDRTMDPAAGLIDTQCNPRTVFHALKHAHAWLASGRAAGDPSPTATGPVLDLVRGCIFPRPPGRGLFMPVDLPGRPAKS